jgi:pimeloyl-ACP methyl ester carboxylesterase
VSAGLFVPGWGAPGSLYLRGVPDGWEVLELPSFRRARGSFAHYRGWLRGELVRRGARVALGGHSMGGALALLAALDEPALVERLVLVSPAGLPLAKPLSASAVTFVDQLLRRSYPPRALCRMAKNTFGGPRAALALARAVHGLDLTPELACIRDRGVPITVIGCPGDALVTGAHCRRLAELAGARYREIDARNGHIWPVTQPELLKRELAGADEKPAPGRAPA